MSEGFTTSEAATIDLTPRHGDRGEGRGSAAGRPGVVVAISREAGSRATSIARRVGRRLGWDVYDQEVLEYLTQNESERSRLLDDAVPAVAAWTKAQLDRLERAGLPAPSSKSGDLTRLVVGLAARGRAVIVGRGAGYLLPAETTVHIRIVAAEADRVAYVGQEQRLPAAEAAAVVRRRDARQAEFLKAHVRADSADPHDFDLVLNSSRLGEEACAELILAAVRTKEQSTNAE